MRKLTITTFMSLDGVAQAPGGPDEDRDGGFVHGGWAVPYLDERIIQLMTGVTARAGVLLLGRRTYDIFAATWPLADVDDPIGARMNGLLKYVASRTLEELSWQNSALLTGDVASAVAKLKREDGGEIQVHGSGGLSQTLLRHDLVDELHLLVFPGGAVLSTYTRTGVVEYGAMGPETGNWR